jgi:hypothetical protein
VIDWKTVANTLRIGTEKGSGGGTARALSIVTDGTARLTFSATAEAMTMPAAFTEFFAAGFGLGVRRSDNSTFMFGHSHSQGFLINSSSSLGFAAGADNAPVARVSYTSTGTFLDLRSAGGIRSRLLDNSADAPISASTGTFSSTVTTSKLFLSGAGSNVWIQQTASNQMDFAVNDSARLRINTAGITFLDTGEGFGFSDAKFYRDAAGVLGQRNSTTSQCLAVYNTYTSSTSYERGVFDWKTTANTLRIGTEKGSGGGTARALSLVTDGIARLNIAATGAAVFTSSVWSQPGNGYNGYVQFNGAGNQYPYFTLGATNLEFQFVLNGPGGGTVDMRCPSTLRIQDQSGNNPQSFTAKDMTLSPSASRTLSGNGQFTIEMTSNTAGNLVYRGSDGTTRRHALTFI